jgi:hypothetical protein
MPAKQPLLQAFAIVRLDGFLPEATPISHRVTVKKIVWSQEEAESEVERLNQQAAEPSIQSFWQTTRVAPLPVATTTGSPPDPEQ